MPYQPRTQLQGTFVNDCRTYTHAELVDRWVYRPVPYAFRKNPKDFAAWRSKLAGCLGIPDADVVIVGSTAAGLSLSPDKGLKMHAPTSDVDVAVISRMRFDEAWTWLLDQKTRRVGYPVAVNAWIGEHQTTHIFYKKIACDQYLEYLPFGRQWLNCLERAGKEKPAQGRSVKLRIYADKAALTNYTASGIGVLRQRLSLPGA